jgi:rod shape-determining protein MreC
VHDKTIRRRRAVLALLVVVSLILLTDYFGESSSSPLHSLQRGVVAVLSPIQDGASKVLSPVRDVTNWFSSTLRAKSRNEQLTAANVRLTNEVTKYQAYAIEYAQAEKLLKLDNTYNLGSYGLVSAHVIGRDTLPWFDQIEIDKGSDDGVRVDDPVVGQAGLVGDVLAVTASTSEVTLIVSPKFAVGAMVEATQADSVQAYPGVLQPAIGDTNSLVLGSLSPNAQVSPGEDVVTSGFRDSGDPTIESYYPPGIPIGEISNQNAQNTVVTSQEVDVSPFVNFTQLSLVQVLTKPHAGS